MHRYPIFKLFSFSSIVLIICSCTNQEIDSAKHETNTDQIQSSIFEHDSCLDIRNTVVFELFVSGYFDSIVSAFENQHFASSNSVRDMQLGFYNLSCLEMNSEFTIDSCLRRHEKKGYIYSENQSRTLYDNSLIDQLGTYELLSVLVADFSLYHKLDNEYEMLINSFLSSFNKTASLGIYCEYQKYNIFNFLFSNLLVVNHEYPTKLAIDSTKNVLPDWTFTDTLLEYYDHAFNEHLAEPDFPLSMQKVIGNN